MSTTPLRRTRELKDNLTISPQQNEKGHVTDDPDPDSLLSDSSWKRNKRDKKKKRRKHRKYDSSGPSSSDDSDSSDGSDYIRKQLKRKIYQKKDQIKICTRLTEKFLTTA